MIEIKVRQDQLDWAKDYIKQKGSIAKRGIYDGRKEFEQIIGKMGEKVVADSLGIKLDNKSGFDNGIDIEIGQYKIDVKTKVRRAKLMPWFAWNIPISQFRSKKYQNNVYLFCSYNDDTNWLTVAGFTTKISFIKRCLFLPKGAYRVRQDGKKFPTNEGYPLEMMEIPQCALYGLRNWQDLKWHAIGGTK